MSKETKTVLWSSLIVVSVLLECTGIYKLAAAALGGGSPGRGVQLVMVGIVLGVISVLMRQLTKAKPDDTFDADKVAVETLARLAKTDTTKSIHKQ